MKRKLTTKALSVFVATLMVITSLPLSAITAFADVTVYSNGSVYEYMTGSTKSGFSGNATWDSSANAWSFNGSQYIKLDDNPLADVTEDSGFVISFDVFNPDNNLDNYYFSFGNYSMLGSSADWWNRYRTDISNGTGIRSYYNSDFDDSSFCTYTASKDGNDLYPVNEWYTMKFVMSADGSYSYYNGDTLLCTFRADYVNTANGGGVTNADAAAAISSATSYLIGATDVNGSNGFTGYMRNLKIYSSKEVYDNPVSNEQIIADAMDAYEAKMDGTVYTNMSAAYEAYVNCQATLDAYKYGENTDVDFSAAASNLINATAAMQPWTPATATAVPSFEHDSAGYSYTVGGHKYYNNILYTEPGYSSESNAGMGNVKDVESWLYYPDTVLMYTGQSSLPEMPIMLKAKDNVNGAALWGYDRYLIAYYPVNSDNTDSSNFYLYNNWNAAVGQQNRDLDWTWTMGASASDRGTNRTPLRNSSYGDFDEENYYSLLLTPQSGVSEYRAALANSFVFNGNFFNYNFSTAKMQDSASYMATYYPKFALVAGEDSNNVTYIAATTPIRIFNYRFVCEAINVRKSILSQVADYKEGDLSRIMRGFDKVTTDPNTFFSSSNNYLDCLNNYENGVNEIYTEPTNYGQYYQALRDLFATTNYYGDTPKMIREYPETEQGDVEAYGGYNGVMWLTYKDIYDNTILEFHDLVTNGYSINGLTDYNALYGTFMNMTKDGRVDVESAGEYVTMGNVIYTHAAGMNYNYYGQKIADNYNYDPNNSAQSGERVTFIDVKYPYFINPENPKAVICISDSILPNGFSKGNYLAVPVSGQWQDIDGTTYTDAQAEEESQYQDVFMRYYLTGTVSDYYSYRNGAYVEDAAEMLVNYVNKADYDAASDKTTVKSYGEYEFPYVMANPSMAHQIIGIRNQKVGTFGLGSRKTGTVYFGRFLGSEGKATSLVSGLTQNTNLYDVSGSVSTSDFPFKMGTGIYNYLTTFGSNESLYIQDGEQGTFSGDYVLPNGVTGTGSTTASVGDNKYKSPLLTGMQFSFMDDDEGINSGSYAMLEHTDEQYPSNDPANVSFSNAGNVVETDYYIDYSDDTNLSIKHRPDGTPYYQFELDESNIFWASEAASKGATSYFNVFGNLANQYNSGDLSISYSTKEHQSGLATWNTSYNVAYTYNSRYYYTQNEYFVDLQSGCNSDVLNVGNVLTAEQGNDSPFATRLELLGINPDNRVITRNETEQLTLTGAKRAFTELPKLDKNTSNNVSNAWTGRVLFTGSDTIEKQTDTSSAETYSNYVLELGTVTKIDNATYVYSTTEDTYQYYNIGVHTCDKTAIRTFLEKYVNKQLLLDEDRNVVLDENGEPTVVTDEKHPNGEILSGDYSFTTYQKYLDAIAAIYADVNDYKDTKVGDTAQDNVTAYNADGSPIFNGTKTGKDIHNEETAITTDVEQVALIQAVIDAYMNLLDIQSFDKFRDEYEQIINTAEEDGGANDVNIYPSETETDISGNPIIIVDAPQGKFTQPSIDDFSRALTLANVFYNYYEDHDHPDPDKNYWRETTLQYEEYVALNEMVQAAADALKLAIDNEELVDTILEKSIDLSGGIYGDTEYTARSWFDLYNKFEESNAVNAACYDENFKLKAMYKEDPTTTKTVTFLDVPYTYVQQGTEYSDEQAAVYYDCPILQDTNLKVADKPSTYQTFDIVTQVVTEMDRGKYTDEGLALVDALYEQLTTGADPTKPSVYISIDPDQQALYSSITGQSIELSKLKATTYDAQTGSETDKLSAQLLDLINTLDENYYNMFEAFLTVQDQEGNIVDGIECELVDAGKYGDILTIDASDYCADAKSIKWSLTLTDGNDKPIGRSKKLSSYYGTTLELKADANVHATAILSTELPEDSWTIYVYNYYSNVTDVRYVLKDDYPDLNELSGDEIAALMAEPVEPAVIPFYTFVGFTAVQTDDSTIYLRPQYTGEQVSEVALGSDGISFGHIDKPYSKSADTVYSYFGTGVTINYSSRDFYAYASKCDGSDKYRIVSYNPNYQFAAYEDETYYVITYVEGAEDTEPQYRIKDGDYLTPENVEGFHKPAGVVRTDQEVINFMIRYKEPFVYTQTYKQYNDGTNDLLRCYFRITAGNTKDQAVGVNYLMKVYDQDSGTYKVNEYTKNIDNVASSGQFTVTVRKDGITYKKVPMRAYATYPYTYTFIPYEGEPTQQLINTTAYSSWTYDWSGD